MRNTSKVLLFSFIIIIELGILILLLGNFPSTSNRPPANLTTTKTTDLTKPENTYFTTSETTNLATTEITEDNTSQPTVKESNSESNVLSEFYNIVNDHRESIGLTRVKRDAGLERYAEHYADRILDNGTIAHHLIDGEKVTWYVNHFSDIDYQSISEILQQGPYEKLKDFRVVFRNFLSSPDHRKYIEASYVETIGAYAVVSGNGMIIFAAYLGDIDGNR